jgi:hypothetical protein
MQLDSLWWTHIVSLYLAQLAERECLSHGHAQFCRLLKDCLKLLDGEQLEGLSQNSAVADIRVELGAIRRAEQTIGLAV